MTKIIAVCGTKQAGKSSLCQFIRLYCLLRYTDDIQSPTTDIIRQTEDGELCLYGYNIPNDYDQYRKVSIYSFADSLKDFCINVMGLTQTQCYGTDKEKNEDTSYLWENLPDFLRQKYKYSGNMTGREVLQIFGTEIMRNMFDPDIWVNCTINKIKNESPDIALISDMRFKTEAEGLFQEPNSYVIRLKRRLFSDNHASETDLNDYDFSKWGNRYLEIDNTNLSIGEKNKLVLDFLKNIF